jgi:DNA gyrase subunit B
MSSPAAEKPVDELLEAIKAATAAAGTVVGHFGAIEFEGEQRTWWSIRFGNAAQKLLTNPDYKVAQILSVLGNEVRLAILRTLLSGPRSAAELVSELGMGTTGQAYHHLRELQRAGYVEQREGRFHLNLRFGRVYLTALGLAADAGAESGEEGEE